MKFRIQYIINLILNRVLLGTFLTILLIFNYSLNYAQSCIEKNGVGYDFTFAELAVKYLETNDSVYLKQISECDATRHLKRHFEWSQNKTILSEDEFIKNLLSKKETYSSNLTTIRDNIQFAKESIANLDIPCIECLKYLPKGFQYSSKLFFTVGYDLGVVFQNNSSVNIAHSHYIKYKNEIKYYSIHELHHAGFMILKGNMMPSLNISTHDEMAKLIEFLTQMEGMAVYSAMEIRIKENSMYSDNDYVALQDSIKMKEYEKNYFDILNYFKNSQLDTITDNDWEMFSLLSGKDRLWYRVGAKMSLEIDKTYGREKLTSLISLPSENFINTYLMLK